MKIVLIGITGSGKSTQGKFLSEVLHVPHISTGHIFRDISNEQTPLGEKIKELTTQGILVPDDETIHIVEEFLQKPEYTSGYILDGFPRTVAQAQKFHDGVDKAIYLRVSDKEALWRLAHRADLRDDETIGSIKRRVDSFHTVTDPVIDYFKDQGKLIEIDGQQSVGQISRDMAIALGLEEIHDE